MVETYSVICILTGLFAVFSVLFINAVTFEKASNCKYYRYFHVFVFAVLCGLFIVNLVFFNKIKLEKEVEWDDCCYKENAELEKDINAQVEASRADLWRGYEEHGQAMNDSNFVIKTKAIGGYLEELCEYDEFKKIVEQMKSEVSRVKDLVDHYKNDIETAFETFKAQTETPCFQVTQDLKNYFYLFDELNTMSEQIEHNVGQVRVGLDRLDDFMRGMRATYTPVPQKNLHTNIISIDNRFTEALKVVEEWKLAPRVDSRNPKWLSIIFYVSSGLLIVFNVIPIIPLFVWLCSKKPNSALKIILITNHYLTIVTLIVLSTMCAVFLSFDIIMMSQKYPLFARDKFQSNFSITLVGNKKISAKSVCIEADDTFLKVIKPREVLNYDDFWGITDLRFVEGMYPRIMSEKAMLQNHPLIPSGIERTKSNIQWFCDRWQDAFDNNCFSLSQMKRHGSILDEAETLNAVGKYFDYFARKQSASLTNATLIGDQYFSQCLIGLKSQFHEGIRNIHNDIKKADFSCRKIVEAENKCKNSEVPNFFFFTSLLFAACFVSILAQTFPNPWIVVQKNAKNEVIALAPKPSPKPTSPSPKQTAPSPKSTAPSPKPTAPSPKPTAPSPKPSPKTESPNPSTPKKMNLPNQ